MKKLSNTEAELKKSGAYRKNMYFILRKFVNLSKAKPSAFSSLRFLQTPNVSQTFQLQTFNLNVEDTHTSCRLKSVKLNDATRNFLSWTPLRPKIRFLYYIPASLTNF